MPRVPSLPIKSRVMSYPAEDFLEAKQSKAQHQNQWVEKFQWFLKSLLRVSSNWSLSSTQLYSTELNSYLALEPVLTIVPSLNTAVKLSTFSLMLPYRTAVDPLQWKAVTENLKEGVNEEGRGEKKRGQEHGVECRWSILQYSDISNTIHSGGEEGSFAQHNR